MIIEGNRITADEGKVLRRIKDKLIVGKTVALGYTYYMYNALLAEPILEVASDYEEINE